MKIYSISNYSNKSTHFNVFYLKMETVEKAVMHVKTWSQFVLIFGMKHIAVEKHTQWLVC